MTGRIERSFVALLVVVGSCSIADAAHPQVLVRQSDGVTYEYTAPQRVGLPHIETHPLTRGAPTFNVEYLDVTNNTNIGFDDPALGATRRATFAAVLSYLSSAFDETGSADIEVLESQLDGGGALATAGAFYLQIVRCEEGFVFQHITTGVDPFAGFPDAQMQVDFGHTWNNELDPPVGSEFDLYSVLLHEMTHALGFLSLVDQNGNGLSGTDPDTRAAGYDDYLQNGNGLALVNCVTGAFIGSTNDLIGLNNGLKHAGPNTVAAWQALGNAGNAPLYAPNPYQPGSSTGHWDSSDPNVPADALMRHNLPNGVANRVYTTLDLGALADIGYTLATAPMTGDIDGDGDVDLDDATALVAVLLGMPLDPAHVARSDLNGDGNEDGLDIQPFVDAYLP